MELAWGSPVSSSPSSWYEPFTSRATLSLQHLWRIGEVTQVNWWFGAIAFCSGEHEIQNKVVSAYKIWWEMHDRPQRSSSFDDADADAVLDAWDIKYGRRHHHESPMEETRTRMIPDWDINIGDIVDEPPFLAVQVAELPRNSDIEWQALGARAKEVRIEVKEIDLAEWGSLHARIRIVQTITVGSGVCIFCYIPDTGSEDYLAGALAKVMSSIEKELGTVAPDCLPPDQTPYAVLYTNRGVTSSPWNLQIIPCRSVWDERGVLLAAALVVHLR
ncbi:hypothetical protein KEM54_001135 [Ascosphaera aggregata]|nr:hypothetical protein KEM54_001135 [Ascosphaera aggregata]